MKKIGLRLLLCLSLMLSTSAAWSQEGGATSEDDIFEETMGDAVAVGACAVGGAVLGLSTLSFVEEPKDHLKNVIVGLAIGTIVGVGVVAFKQANKSKESYEQSMGMRSRTPTPQFSTAQRAMWHNKSSQKHKQKINALTALGYSFQF